MKIHIPFFGGTSSAAYSDKKNRLDYLFQNIASFYIDVYVKFQREIDITIHVCNKEDEAITKKLFPHLKFVFHDINNPIFLASHSVKWIQENENQDDLIFYSEADQAYKIKSLNTLIEYLNDTNYLSPHRIEEIPAVSPRCHHPNNNEFLNLKDRLFLVQNRRNFNGEKYEKNDKFYKPIDWDLGFGGAFLILNSALKKVPVSFSNNFPVEHASGIDLFNNLQCLKTVDIFDFYCIHLSGYEKNLSGKHIINEKM